jgi:DNA adenine methylase
MKPLFKWAGGKSHMLKHYQPFIPTEIKTYSEPFFGGGAMFIHVMKTRAPKRVIINDINVGLMNIYQCIKDDYPAFLSHLDQLDRTYIPKSQSARKAYFYDVRHEHAYDYEGWEKPQEAATLYFLLRTSCNGIYQTNFNTNGRFGTASGLLNEVGSVYDREITDYWHTALQKVEIRVGDWTEAVTIDVDGSFTFLDPPYRGSFTSYGQEFGDERQREVVEFCKATSADVFLCNRCVGDRFFEAEISDSDLKIERFNTTYTAGRRKRVDRTDDDGQECRAFEAKKATELLVHRSR